MSFSDKVSVELIKQAGLASSAAKLIGGEERAMETAGRAAIRGLEHSGVKQHKAIEYTLKLDKEAPEWQKVLHYGVTPVQAYHSIKTDVKGVQRAKQLDPESESGVKLNPNEKKYLKQKAVRRAYGNLAGNAASWALFPLQFRSLPASIAFGVGTGIGLPMAGAALGERSVRLKKPKSLQEQDKPEKT